MTNSSELFPATVPDLPGFASFWQAYPNRKRKVGKGKCREIWERKGLESQGASIAAHVVAMSRTEQWRSGFEPAPMTYLNQGRWEDPVPPTGPQNAARAFFEGLLTGGEDGAGDQATLGGNAGELRPVLQDQMGGLFPWGDGEAVDAKVRAGRG